MIISLHFQKANLNYSWSYPTEHIQMGVSMSEMRYAKTKILIVTCYLLLLG